MESFLEKQWGRVETRTVRPWAAKGGIKMISKEGAVTPAEKFEWLRIY